jgi:peroxiredoxin
LRQDYQKFIDLDTEIIVIGPEDQNDFQAYWLKEKLPFIAIPDRQQNIIKLYGQQIKLLRFGRMPAQFINDKQGRVKYVHYGNSMSDIPSNDEILELIETTH